MIRASEIEPRELTADDVIRHLLDVADDVFENIRATSLFENGRLQQRAGSIIDAYEPEFSIRENQRRRGGGKR